MCDSSQVNDIWYSAVPGDEVTKTAAKESLAREWEARFRVPSTDYEEVKACATMIEVDFFGEKQWL